MKKMLVILTMCFFTAGCNEEETTQQENPIYGTWQLIESFSHPPSGNGWNQVENGFKITIEIDNSFNSNQFSNCRTGNVNLTTNHIDLIYDCNEFTAGYENPPGVFKFSYEFVESKLEMTPQNYICVEGCKYRLIKITSEK